MPIEEKLIGMLVSNGMFDTQAGEVLERAKADEVNKSMQGCWHDAAEDYPENFFNVLWLNTKYHAIEWIDENLPQAWFRPMLESD